jgi:hypothetical protein
MKKVALFLACAVLFGSATVKVSAQDRKVPATESRKPVVQKEQKKVASASQKEEKKLTQVKHKKDSVRAKQPIVKKAPATKQQPKKVVKPLQSK